MSTAPPPPGGSHGRHAGHGHAVDLDTTIDFLNTLEYEDGFPVEHLPTLESAIDWLVGRNLVHDQARLRALGRRRGAEADLERLRDGRSAMRALSDAVAEHRPPPQGALRSVNQIIRDRAFIELVPTADGLDVGHRHVGDPIPDALGRLAEPLVAVIASGDTERLRVCANDECRWVFYDSSRTGRRRWCDMATCGNRAKVARHRARAKAADAPMPSPGPQAAPAATAPPQSPPAQG